MRFFLGLLITIGFFSSTTHLKAGVPGSGGNLQVVGEARNKLRPSAVIGYSGGGASVLKFDLEVMVSKMVP